MPVPPTIRSRAAIIGVGAWGLQTVFHVWPRLRFQQDQRSAQGGLSHDMPNLNNLVSYAVVHVDPKLCTDSDASSHVPSIRLYMPLDLGRGKDRPEPMFVEKILKAHQIKPGSISDKELGNLTESEYVGEVMFNEASKYLQLVETIPITVRSPDPTTSPTRIDRQDVRGSIQAQAGRLANLIESQVIDPTRLDRHAYRDPHIQTTIYVLCSLNEPLATAIAWPLVAALRAQMDVERVAEVVLLAMTGSFSSGESRRVEEASCWVAVCELDELIREQPEPGAQRARRKRFRELTGLDTPRLLFDRSYVLDRQKTSGALADSPQELSVTVGNAVEAFVAADASHYLNARLGPDSQDLQRRAPFSTLGTASDFVPVDQLRWSVINGAYKDILRQHVLRPQEVGPWPTLAMSGLGLEPTTLGEWVRDRLDPAVFEMPDRVVRPDRWFRRLPQGNQVDGKPAQDTASARRSPSRWFSLLSRRGRSPDDERSRDRLLPVLSVRWRFFLPDEVRATLRRQRTLREWSQSLQQHVRDLRTRHQVQFEHDFARRLSATRSRVIAEASQGELKTWCRECREERWENRDRGSGKWEETLGTIFKAIRERSLDHPGGLAEAKEALDTLIRNIHVSRRALEDEPSREAQTQMEHQERFRQLQADQFRLDERRPFVASVVARLGLLALFVANLLFIFQLYPRPEAIDAVGLLRQAGGLALLVVAGALAVWLVHRIREARWKHRMEVLQRDRFNEVANSPLRRAMLSFYVWLVEELEPIRAVLDTALRSLRKEAEEIEEEESRRAEIETSHLRRAWGDSDPAILALFRQELKQRAGWMQGSGRMPQLTGKTASTFAEGEWCGVIDEWRRDRPPGVADGLSQAFDATPWQQAYKMQLEQQRRIKAAQAAQALADPASQPEPPTLPLATPLEEEEDIRREVAGWPRDTKPVDLQEAVSLFIKGLLGGFVEIPHSLFQGQEHNIENLIERAQGSDSDREPIIENLFLRAKPSLSYDPRGDISKQTIDLAVGTVGEIQLSPYAARIMQRRQIDVLPSYDNFSLLMLQTVHGLSVRDLVQVVERYSKSYVDLLPSSKDAVGFTSDLPITAPNRSHSGAATSGTQSGAGHSGP